jgi:hypothetical protein
LEHWNNGAETTDGSLEHKKFPNKAIFSVDEASSFVLDDNTSTRLADGQLPKVEKPNEAIFNRGTIMVKVVILNEVRNRTNSVRKQAPCFCEILTTTEGGKITKQSQS